MLRPWNAGEVGTCGEDQYSLGCTAWRRRLAAPRGTRAFVADRPALTHAQRRKLSNIFAEVGHATRTSRPRHAYRCHCRLQVTQKQSAVASQRIMREADVVRVHAAAHLAAAGVAYDDAHELVQAARAWFAFFADRAGTDEAGEARHRDEGMSLRQFLEAATTMLAADELELPEAVAALPALQFKLAAGTAAQLSKPQFVAWRLATGRLTAAQLSKATLTDGIGGQVVAPIAGTVTVAAQFAEQTLANTVRALGVLAMEHIPAGMGHFGPRAAAGVGDAVFYTGVNVKSHRREAGFAPTGDYLVTFSFTPPGLDTNRVVLLLTPFLDVVGEPHGYVVSTGLDVSNHLHQRITHQVLSRLGAEGFQLVIRAFCRGDHPRLDNAFHHPHVRSQPAAIRRIGETVELVT
jgi:hypothetical protein